MRSIDFVAKLAAVASIALIMAACGEADPETGTAGQQVASGSDDEADDCVNGVEEDGEPCDADEEDTEDGDDESDDEDGDDESDDEDGDDESDDEDDDDEGDDMEDD